MLSSGNVCDYNARSRRQLDSIVSAKFKTSSSAAETLHDRTLSLRAPERGFAKGRPPPTEVGVFGREGTERVGIHLTVL
jgi:hypothetical protein